MGTRTPAQYFEEHQAATVTRHGRVVAGSAREADGRIEFGTVDGSR